MFSSQAIKNYDSIRIFELRLESLFKMYQIFSKELEASNFPQT